MPLLKPLVTTYIIVLSVQICWVVSLSAAYKSLSLSTAVGYDYAEKSRTYERTLEETARRTIAPSFCESCADNLQVKLALQREYLFAPVSNASKSAQENIQKLNNYQSCMSTQQLQSSLASLKQSIEVMRCYVAQKSDEAAVAAKKSLLTYSQLTTDLGPLKLLIDLAIAAATNASGAVKIGAITLQIAIEAYSAAQSDKPLSEMALSVGNLCVSHTNSLVQQGSDATKISSLQKALENSLCFVQICTGGAISTRIMHGAVNVAELMTTLRQYIELNKPTNYREVQAALSKVAAHLNELQQAEAASYSLSKNLEEMTSKIEKGASLFESKISQCVARLATSSLQEAVALRNEVYKTNVVIDHCMAHLRQVMDKTTLASTQAYGMLADLQKGAKSALSLIDCAIISKGGTIEQALSVTCPAISAPSTVLADIDATIESIRVRITRSCRQKQRSS